ncbi:hypothetical protein RF11_01374 [Thelohanellus kitauei]|uniref:Uncharacterized protein n=1 Tax=Thelohanellus kitauei TaxID=669202 RepID=A0A0C2N693_THEKT|nr:hypothetical protein RF11_01374 [Thelohanellus kitauei]
MGYKAKSSKNLLIGKSISRCCMQQSYATSESFHIHNSTVPRPEKLTVMNLERKGDEEPTNDNESEISGFKSRGLKIHKSSHPNNKHTYDRMNNLFNVDHDVFLKHEFYLRCCRGITQNIDHQR